MSTRTRSTTFARRSVTTSAESRVGLLETNCSRSDSLCVRASSSIISASGDKVGSGPAVMKIPIHQGVSATSRCTSAVSAQSILLQASIHSPLRCRAAQDFQKKASRPIFGNVARARSSLHAVSALLRFVAEALPPSVVFPVRAGWPRRRGSPDAPAASSSDSTGGTPPESAISVTHAVRADPAAALTVPSRFLEKCQPLPAAAIHTSLESNRSALYTYQSAATTLLPSLRDTASPAQCPILIALPLVRCQWSQDSLEAGLRGVPHK